MSSHLCRAGRWFVRSGIQESSGGVARHYRVDLGRNSPISTEITGYAVSALVFLHSATGDEEYLDRALKAARFLAGTAWDASLRTMPFEMGPPAYTYFFDCGIIVRGLLAAWRAGRSEEFLETAAALGRAMASDFVSAGGDFHPVLSLPGKQPVERDAARWSRNPGCYQLKAALGWWELGEATGEARFREAYDLALDQALGGCADFLPGDSDPLKVMDRLHAFLYFLEGLLPRAEDARCAAAIGAGMRRVAAHLREIAPDFERSDVYAQLLRMRVYADAAGAAPLDREAAQFEAAQLAGFQSAGDSRVDGGFYFGRRSGEWLPYVNPVSTAFAMEALALWEKPWRPAGLPI